MSYAPTPAGHDGAPLERTVSVEKDSEIEALVQYVQRLREDAIYPYRIASTYDEEKRHLEAFFTSRAPWQKDRVDAALADPRLSFPFKAFNRGRNSSSLIMSTGPKLTEYDLQDILVPVALSLCPDTVLINDGHYFGLSDLGEQPHKVLIDHTANHFMSNLGRGTSKTFYILTNDHTALEYPTLGFSQSLIVNLGSFKGACSLMTRHLTGTGTTYVGRSPRRLTLRFDGETINNYLSLCSTHIAQFPRISAYMDEIFEHCTDPYALHDIYGPTPGPTIRAAITTLLAQHDEAEIRHVLQLPVTEQTPGISLVGHYHAPSWLRRML